MQPYACLNTCNMKSHCACGSRAHCCASAAERTRPKEQRGSSGVGGTTLTGVVGQRPALFAAMLLGEYVVHIEAQEARGPASLQQGCQGGRCGLSSRRCRPGNNSAAGGGGRAASACSHRGLHQRLISRFQRGLDGNVLPNSSRVFARFASRVRPTAANLGAPAARRKMQSSEGAAE